MRSETCPPKSCQQVVSGIWVPSNSYRRIYLENWKYGYISTATLAKNATLHCSSPLTARTWKRKGFRWYLRYPKKLCVAQLLAISAILSDFVENCIQTSPIFPINSIVNSCRNNFQICGGGFASFSKWFRQNVINAVVWFLEDRFAHTVVTASETIV